MCDLDGACDSCDYDIDCCEPCVSCNPCGCGGMMGGTNPGPYVAYLIPMESYQGELCGDMCCDGFSGCGTCGPGIIQGEIIDDGFIDGGACLGGDCQTYMGDDQGWHTVPGQLQAPHVDPSGSDLQTVPQKSDTDDSDVPEGQFEGATTSGQGTQAGYLPPQNNFLVPPNQL